MKIFLFFILFFLNSNIFARDLDDIKVSIVIPAYNVENYINQALDSILNQTHRNIEVIIVDDASADNTYSILKQYAKKDNRIKLYRLNKNGGASKARNSGMKHITGDYTYFFDSDDWLDLDYIEKLLKTATETNADVIINKGISAYNRGNDLGNIFKLGKNLKVGSIEVNGKNLHLIDPPLTFLFFYKTSYLEKIKIMWPAGLIQEDVYFAVAALSATDKIFVVDKPIYHYRVRDYVIDKTWVHRITKFDLIEINKLIYIYLKKNNLLNKGKMSILLLRDHLCNHSEQNRFYDELRELFLEAEDDVKNNIEIYDEKELMFFNDVIKCETFNSYIKYLKRRKLLLCLILIALIAIICFILVAFLKCLWLFIVYIINHIKNDR